MQRYAFKMFLNPGQAHESRRRHDAIWPELKALLSDSGVSNYSIFLDPETNTLFAYRAHRGPAHGRGGEAFGDASLVGAYEGYHGRQSGRQPG
jgi:L-rhamnose mutarotase